MQFFASLNLEYTRVRIREARTCMGVRILPFHFADHSANSSALFACADYVDARGFRFGRHCSHLYLIATLPAESDRRGLPATFLLCSYQLHVATLADIQYKGHIRTFLSPKVFAILWSSDCLIRIYYSIK